MSHHRLLFPGLTAGLFALVAFGASAASAQSVTTAAPSAAIIAPVTIVGTGTSDSAAVTAPAAQRTEPAGFRATTTTERSMYRQDESMGVGRNVAMMGVGAAGLLTGLIIGGSSGTALAIGGGVIGLWGLYKFLQ